VLGVAALQCFFFGFGNLLAPETTLGLLNSLNTPLGLEKFSEANCDASIALPAVVAAIGVLYLVGSLTNSREVAFASAWSKSAVALLILYLVSAGRLSNAYLQMVAMNSVFVVAEFYVVFSASAVTVGKAKRH